MRNLLFLLFALECLNTLGESFEIKTSLLLGTDASNINIRANGSDNYQDHRRTISNKNAKASFIEIKYLNPKLSLGTVHFYPLVMTGYASELFLFDTKGYMPPFSYNFSQKSMLNTLLIGGKLSPMHSKDYSFYFETGIVFKHYFAKKVNIDFVEEYESTYTELHISSINKDNLGLILRTGIDLKLNKNNGLSFGITRLTARRNLINYSFMAEIPGGGGVEDGNNSFFNYSKNYKFWCLNIGYQHTFNLRKH